MEAIYTITLSPLGARDLPAKDARTPDEFFFGKNFRRAHKRVSCFDSALDWWRFG